MTLCINNLHCCLSLANREHFTIVLFEQSLMSSVHLRVGLPRLLLLNESNISVHRFLSLTTWPKYWSLRRCRLTVVNHAVAALHQGAPGHLTWLEDPPPWIRPGSALPIALIR